MSEITSSSLKCVVVTGIVVGVATGLTGEVADQTKTLRMATWLPPVHLLVKTLERWGQEVSKASGDLSQDRNYESTPR